MKRRDFVATTFGLALGYGAFAMLPKLAPETGVELLTRNPAANELDREAWSLISSHRELESHYDVLVIGSGYGGSILASRLAKPGRKVAILERGREWLPGDFPLDRTHLLMMQRTPVNPLGLMDLHTPLFSDADIICASGVGGTSLINAAIATRPEAIVFEQPEWPREIREAAAQGKLAPLFERVERMLKPNVAPQIESLQLVKEHDNALRALKVPSDRLRLNVNHAGSQNQRNEWGVPRSPCTLCGDCVMGCNVGAKNTLQTNYLPLARSRGAKIFSSIEVEWIEKREGGGYIVHCQPHPDPMRDGIRQAARDIRPRKITAQTVIVAAGSLGSTEIMLKSRAKGGLNLSDALGTRFSTNGDVAGFAYNGRERTNVIGYGTTVKGIRVGSPVGQSIMAYGDYRTKNASSPDLQDRFLLLEAAVPQALANTIAKGLAAWALAHQSKFSREQLERVKLDLKNPMAPHPEGALNHSMFLLACGHDSASGRFEYHRMERPRIKWPGLQKERFYAAINSEMSKHAEQHGGVYIENPRSTALGGKRLMVPHPLGGCPMGESVREGVVDHLGRVFDPRTGGAHEGLYIADGSIIPRSLAATPLMTISALSERIADKLSELLG